MAANRSIEILKITFKKGLLLKYNSEAIDMKLFVSETDWRKLRKQAVPIFANISIPNRSIEIPLISDSFKLKKAVYDVLEIAHEATKEQLAQMRKAGTAPNETVSEKEKKVIKPIKFDTVQEQQLLEDLNKKRRRIMEKHFTYIAIQNFYYKYRDLDEMYVKKCIDYCLDDIAMLPDIQKCYHKEETERIQALASFYGKKEIAEKLKAIGPFSGGIPAFYRLAVIYEKRKDYIQAITICDQAIEYYNSFGMSEGAFEFKKRREKLQAKL